MSKPLLGIVICAGIGLSFGIMVPMATAFGHNANASNEVTNRYPSAGTDTTSKPKPPKKKKKNKKRGPTGTAKLDGATRPGEPGVVGF